MADIGQTLQEILKELQKQTKSGGTGRQQSSSQADPTARGASKTIGGKFGQMADMLRQTKAGFQAGQQGGLTGMMGQGGVGAGAGKAGMAGAVVQIGVEIAKIPGRVKEFADQLHAANKQLAQFSPGMAAVMAQSDIREMMLTMKKGEALAPSAQNLAEARNRLAEAQAPYQTAWDKLKNNTGSLFSNMVSNFMEKSEFGKQLAKGLEDTAEIMGWASDWFTDDAKKKDAELGFDWTRQLEEEERAKREERRAPVGAPPPQPRRDGVPRGGGGQ